MQPARKILKNAAALSFVVAQARRPGHRAAGFWRAGHPRVQRAHLRRVNDVKIGEHTLYIQATLPDGKQTEVVPVQFVIKE